MKLKCECCGFEQEYVDGEAAFQDGWDAPPHFTGFAVTCPLCPSSHLVLGISHEEVHERWKRTGRPAEFEPPPVK